MNHVARMLLAAAGVALLANSAAAQDKTVRVGMARSISNAAVLLGIERGYFKEFGITVKLETVESSANVMAILAQGGLDIVAGGISAGFFNAIEKELPITITADRVTTPILHNLVLRADLKDSVKQIKDLKGKVIATNGPGSIATYEIGKILESGGLKIDDVEIKIVPFPQYAVALENKAVDLALAIPPFTYRYYDTGLAVPFAAPDDIIKPSPITIAGNLVNTEWAGKNKELVQNYYVALMRGVRDYCTAYHSGDRQAVIDILVSSKTETRPELLTKYPWPSRSLNGRINKDSMADIQNWFKAHGYINQTFPVERLIDYGFVDYANAKLGPFKLAKENPELQGCR